jgi:2-polyprenyl-6-methoxyphenol hydroxylase-like FAD-dependent oxidoreductase
MIIIIGAGISGITLARYLLDHNIPFRIFDQSPAEKPQGFGLTLREGTFTKLFEALDTTEDLFRRAVSVDRKQGSYEGAI